MPYMGKLYLDLTGLFQIWHKNEKIIHVICSTIYLKYLFIFHDINIYGWRDHLNK